MLFWKKLCHFSKIESLERSDNAAPWLWMVLIKQYKRKIMDTDDIVFLQNEAHTLKWEPNFGYYSSKKKSIFRCLFSYNNSFIFYKMKKY